MEGYDDTAGKSPAPTVRKSPGDPLTVSHEVIVEMVRVAALEVQGAEGEPRRAPGRLSGSPVRARFGEGRVSVRVWIVARPGHPLAPLAAQVRQAVGATVVRLLGLELVK